VYSDLVPPPKLSEFAILLTAREWTQPYEWGIHSTIAAKAGLSAEIVKAVADGYAANGNVRG